jgi:hypothetical protein
MVGEQRPDQTKTLVMNSEEFREMLKGEGCVEKFPLIVMGGCATQSGKRRR